MSEPTNLDGLKANPKNPRRISTEDFDSLKNAIVTFGDLSGIVFNETTGQLVGGHQRVQAFKALPADKQIVITKRYEQKTDVGTVAIGYVQYKDEFFGYRVVQWEQPWETAANVAANRISGEFDLDLLAELNYELSQLENGSELLGYTGQREDEVKKLIDMVAGEPEIELPEGDKPGFQQITVVLSDEQMAILNEAMTFIKEHRSFEGMENQNSNGNAVYFVAREFLDYTNGSKDEPS